MRRTIQEFLFLFILFFLAGCNPFTTNIFSGIDKYKMPDLGDADEVLDVKNDAEFYKKLKDDPDAKAEVLATLEEVYNDPDEDDEVKQEAALMAVDVHLKTSDTEDTLNSFNDLISDAANGEEVYSDGDGPEVLFKSLFGDPPYPAGTSSSDSRRVKYTATVKIQLEAFLSAVTPLEVYGRSLKAGLPAPPGTNKGDTATKALMAGMTRFITYSLDTDGDNSTSGNYISGIETADVDALADYLADPDDSASLTYNREPSVPADEDEIEFFLKDPVDSSNDSLVYVVNDGLNLSDLID